MKGRLLDGKGKEGKREEAEGETTVCITLA